MSHFTVLVVGENPEDQLAPFQENNMDDCPEEYLEFFDVTEKYQKQYQERKQDYQSFDAFMSDYAGYDEVDPKTLKHGYWENPCAKWDWYLLGGRWSGYFLLKNGSRADAALNGTIDWQAMTVARAKDAEKDYFEFEAKFAADSNYDATRAWFEFGLLNIGSNGDLIPESRESYIARRSTVATFAVLSGGVWYERGAMGWWAVVTDEKEGSKWNSEFISLVESLSNDTLISLYDCHK